jgi:starch-binding outer membrane protein, SusD/RagB family
VQIDPPQTQLVSATVFSNDQTATAAMIGIYSEMMGDFSGISGGNQSISYLTGLSSDEFKDHSSISGKAQFYTNNLSVDNIYSQNIWIEAYKYIYQCNAIIEGLTTATGVSLQVQKQLKGEALFMRSFCHFYLVNLFGKVPLILSTDYKVNALKRPATTAEVYASVISDLTDAENLLVNDYSISGGEKTRPNKWAAKALLARMYLYAQDWIKAESKASELINNSSFVLEPNLNQVFLKNSSEAIWQLQPVFPGLNTFDAYFYIIRSSPRYVSLTQSFTNAIEPNDQRKTEWTRSIIVSGTTYFYPYKYKVGYGSPIVSEYLMVLRLAEQYLIRAEARAQLDNLAGANSDLNTIRSRAGLPSITATDKATMLDAILTERRIELFSEWGHRWLDLKRMKKTDSVLGSAKAPNWQATDSLYPIPQSEIQKDINLQQNPGY